MNRTIFAIVFGALSLFLIGDIAAGYYHMGAVPSLGTVAVNGSRETFTTVTPAGGAAGIRPGDTIDLRRMDLVTRHYFLSMHGDVGAVFALPLERDGRMMAVRITLQSRPPVRWLEGLDIAMRLILAAAGIVLIARGIERDSLWAGLFVCSLAVGEGFSYRFWGGPIVEVALGACVAIFYFFGMWGGRLLFAFALLPKSVPQWLRWGLIAIGSAAFLALFAITVAGVVRTLSGISIDMPGGARYYGQWVVGAVAVLSLGVAAIYADGQRGRAIRWIFGAILISQIGPWINFSYSLNGQPLPFNGLANVTYLALAIGLPYVVLSQRLVAVNFVVSRALVYTLVLTVIVGVFILLEKGIESAALGRFQSQVFELIVPLGLGLSVKWIEGWAEGLVERLLYRDKLRAEQELHALIEDFPHARDIQGLSTRTAREICRQMHAPLACVYRESGSTYSPIAVAGNGELLPIDADDPVFLRLRSQHAIVHTDDFMTALPRHCAVFPLVVFGVVTGAIVVQNRQLGEAYDPDELQTLKRVAHELAIALLWVERTAASPLAVPAL